MADFGKKVDEATDGEKPQILGVVALAVDRDGMSFCSALYFLSSLPVGLPSLGKAQNTIIFLNKNHG